MTEIKKPRGFAALDKETLKKHARSGGKAAHAAHTAHEFNSEEARAAGRKGGQAAHAKRNAAKNATTTPTDKKDPHRDDEAAADGASADENPDQMGSCGSSGCGSHKS